MKRTHIYTLLILTLFSTVPLNSFAQGTSILTPVTREMFFTKVQTEGDIIIDAGTLGEYLFSAEHPVANVSKHVIRQELVDFLNEIQSLFKEPIKIEVGYRSPEQHIYQWAKWLRDNPDIVATLNGEDHASWEAWVKASQKLKGCPPLQSKHQNGDAVTFVRTGDNSKSKAGHDLLIEHLREMGGTHEYTAAERTLYDIPDSDNYLFNVAGIVNGENLHFYVEYVPSQKPHKPTIDQIGEEKDKAVVKPQDKSPITQLSPITREMFFTKLQTEGDIIIDAGTLGEYLFSAEPQTVNTQEHVIRQELVDFLNEIQLLFKEPIKIEVGYRSPEQHIYQWAKWLRDNPDIIATLNGENHASWEAWVKASQILEGSPPLQSKHQIGGAVTFVRTGDNSKSKAGHDLLIEHLREMGGTRDYTAAERTLYDIPDNDNYLFNVAGIVIGEDLHFYVEYVPSRKPPMPTLDQIGVNVSKPEPETALWSLTNPESSFQVSLSGNSASYHVGDTIILQTESSENVHLILLKWDVNDTLTVIMPNAFREDNFVRADTIDTIPHRDDDYILKLSDTPGTERYKVIALLRNQDNRKILNIFRSEADSKSEGFWRWEGEKSGSIADEISATLDEIDPDNWTEHLLSVKVQEAVPSVNDPKDTESVVISDSFTALLNVTSNPSGARITVDGKLVGITPMPAYEMNIGNTPTKQVKVTLSHEGYHDSEKTITLENGKTATWNNVQLKRATQAPPDVKITKMVLIPAGDFKMGTEGLVGEDTKPVHNVFLNDYYIDVHEVTVGQYREFVEKTEYSKPNWDAVEKVSPTDNHPMVGVSWHDAMAYALWVGKRLPTEAEWEKAARGGHLGKDYPWGTNEINPSFAHYKMKNVDHKVELTQPVKSYAANSYGLYDMSGNVAEWCLDPWDPAFYYRSPANNPFPGSLTIEETIKDYTKVKGLRVYRGGSYTHEKEVCEVGARAKDDSEKPFTNIGFRCVKDVSR